MVNLSDLPENSAKASLDSSGKKPSAGTAAQEKRYYISSLKADAERLGKAIRSHWSVESAPQVHEVRRFCHELNLCA